MADGSYLMGWDNSSCTWVKVAANISGVLSTSSSGDGGGGGDASAANQTTMITSLQLLDDVVATDGSAATTKLYQVGGTDGANAQILSTNSNGHLNIADGGNSITVDGTFWQATQPVSIAAAVAVTDNSSSLTVDAPVGTPVFVRLSDGTSAITNLATNVAQIGGTNTVTGGVNGSLGVGGNVAHDGVDAGNPQKIGAKALAHGANPTAVAAADRTDLYANRHGILWTIGGHPNVITRTIYIADANGAQTDASIVGTINAGTKVVVTSAAVTVDYNTTGPSSSGIAVKLGFGASTIPADSTTGANGIILDHKGIPGGGGVVLGNGAGIIGIGGDGEELRMTSEDPIGGGFSVTVTYYTIES